MSDRQEIEIPREILDDRERFREFVISQAEPFYRKYLGRLYGLWEESNDKLLDSALPAPPYISFGISDTNRAYGTYGKVSDFGGRAEIKIRRSLITGSHPHVQAGKEFSEGRFLLVSDVLLHEMIHQYQHEVLRVDESSYSGHGPAFRDIANDLSKKINLKGEVRASKVRAEKRHIHSCAHWPHNLREPGYYQGAYTRKWKRRLTPVEAVAERILEFSDAQMEDLLKLLEEQGCILTGKNTQPVNEIPEGGKKIMSGIDWLKDLPPIPEEVRKWNESLIEMFCDFSIRNLSNGCTFREADEKAIEQVKKDPRFRERS